ncbi:MAG: hypothetical protein ACKVPX_11345 [Myxococcaceae bacterium]
MDTETDAKPILPNPPMILSGKRKEELSVLAVDECNQFVLAIIRDEDGLRGVVAIRPNGVPCCLRADGTQQPSAPRIIGI